MANPGASTKKPVPFKKQIQDRIARGESFAGVDLRQSDLSGVCFDGVDLSRAKLAHCNLSKSTFRGANLTMASLWQTDCKDAVFDSAILEEADLDLADLEGATFRAAIVRKTIFPRGKVDWRDVDRSVRTGAKLLKGKKRK